jgi:hypothetical protein
VALPQTVTYSGLVTGIDSLSFFCLYFLIPSVFLSARIELLLSIDFKPVFIELLSNPNTGDVGGRLLEFETEGKAVSWGDWTVSPSMLPPDTVPRLIVDREGDKRVELPSVVIGRPPVIEPDIPLAEARWGVVALTMSKAMFVLLVSSVEMLASLPSALDRGRCLRRIEATDGERWMGEVKPELLCAPPLILEDLDPPTREFAREFAREFVLLLFWLMNLGFCSELVCDDCCPTPFDICLEKYPLRVEPGELGLLLMKPMGDTFSVSLSLLVRAGGVKSGLGDGAKRRSLWPAGSKPSINIIHSSRIYLGTHVLS